mmetsp:Transcript_16533/g.49922  ORF Transcript_16533/g.49922 Transcript_16533/m.49922 type:complete len:326 (-) Transcript_16533:247-1224(-)
MSLEWSHLARHNDFPTAPDIALRLRQTQSARHPTANRSGRGSSRCCCCNPRRSLFQCPTVPGAGTSRTFSPESLQRATAAAAIPKHSCANPEMRGSASHIQWLGSSVCTTSTWSTASGCSPCEARRATAAGQEMMSLSAATAMRVGSAALLAATTVTMRVPRLEATSSKQLLSSTDEVQSKMRLGWPPSAPAMNAATPQPPGSTWRATAWTSQEGRISRNLRRHTSTFGTLASLAKATAWQELLEHNPPSISRSLPTPARARSDAAALPTLPRPTTTTKAPRTDACPSAPKNAALRDSCSATRASSSAAFCWQHDPAALSTPWHA